MNYEEKYKEALERAKKLYDSYNRLALSTDEIEEIFPELAESEDERIRKWLCDYFSSIDRAWIHKDITCIDILNWLEKQKEPCLTEEYKEWKKDFDRLRKEKYGRKPSAWDSPIMTNEMIMGNVDNIKNKSGYYKAGKFWKASTLWAAVKDKTPQRVPNRYIMQECSWNIGTLQDFADEIRNVNEVSLDYPIILDINGYIIDGAHRVVKAYLEGKDIDIVYLGDDEWPEPDYDEEKAVKEEEKQKEPHYTKRNELFDECVAKCDSSTMKEVSDNVDKMLNQKDSKVCEENGKNFTISEWSEEDGNHIKRIIGMLEDRAEYFKPYPSEKTITQEEVAWLKSLKPPTADVREEAYNKGHDDGVKETLADLEAEWKHGYDFAKKEDKK